MNMLIAAIDVGTTSARAGIFNPSGDLLGRFEHPILMNRPRPDHAEHDSEDIWRSVCLAMRGALEAADADAAEIKGISFDATCSLVIRDQAGRQLSVSESGSAHWDTIVWLDHRALAEAEACTATGHRVLDYVGGVMSPEMEVPKLLWLKRHFPKRWQQVGFAFDLADYLTWRSTGMLARSQCTLTCKWTYLGHERPGWQQDFLASVGLADLIARGSLPEAASPIGLDLGPLKPEAAADLGLTTSCRVGAGLIDAHAGALGVLGGHLDSDADADRHMALIAGTSSCIMALSRDRRPTPGVWGPYYGAVVPDLWLNEGGQSATGALLDHIIRWHGAGGEPTGAMHRQITERIAKLRQTEGDGFADRLHVLPDFHGNRSPLADPHALGVISGLSLDSSFDSLCRLYWRAAVGIALGLRHILDALNGQGYAIDTLHVTGGHVKNPLLMELYADATGCTVIEPSADDAVLLGTAMVAATAAGLQSNLVAAAVGMNRGGKLRLPCLRTKERYERDYRIFLAMHDHRRAIDKMI